MQIESKYNPSIIENKWYEFWNTNGLFSSKPNDRVPFTIVIPPPNVTGVLHMGHMLNNTIQDVLIRRKRMQGFNVLWVPGTDHASIATEAKVVALLKEKGIDKASLSREEFINYAWEWKEKHGGIILKQLRKLGASCDWNRTKFTMDETLYESVIDVFIDLYEKGLIYRGVRMVNWDPVALTAVSDEEVIYEEQNSKLYYINYPIVDCDDVLTVATTRPETILGDTAVCVNPMDIRFVNVVGKKVLVPLINREIPIISDEYVDMEFGTGCLKITPAHDVNDYNLGIKHNLRVIDILNDNGTLNENAQLYVNKDRFAVRNEIVVDLQKNGFIAKIEPYVNKIGLSERSKAPIEPKLSLQWFMKMKDLAKPALDVVENGTINFYPSKFKNTYRHWMENVKDWCISRQLWWGQRIPVYYLPDNTMIVAKSLEEAYQKALRLNKYENLNIDDLRQDPDVLDTWFSSWLWPISVFDGIRYPENEDIRYYYPTNDLISAPDILFFWIARMIMAGLEYRKDIPFRNVYITGVVRDKYGRKMSKSLGNSPDPLELIAKYGADGVRVGMLLASPAGNDLLFDESLCEQGRNFANKIWNALRLIKGWNVDNNKSQPQCTFIANEWFNAKLNHSIELIDIQFAEYRISEALMTIYKLIWDDFCSWYLEIVKPPYGESIDNQTYNQAVSFFEKLMQLLHPFMPFITEEIWHLLVERQNIESIMISFYPQTQEIPNRANTFEIFDKTTKIITAIRTLRTEKNIPSKQCLSLFVKKNNSSNFFDSIVQKLANINKIEYVLESVENSLSFIIDTMEFYIPISSNIDVDVELEKLNAELKYLQEFVEIINKKLNNHNFIANAPANVVNAEKKKLADTQDKIAVIKNQIKSIQK